MKRIAILICILCLGAVSLRAQDTTRVQTKDPDVHQCNKSDCGCQNHPVNNYSGLNSLRARLANPSWNGKVELFRSIGTGMKIEDGRIKPLVSPGAKKEPEETVNQSANPTEAVTETYSPFLKGIGRGEVPVGPPVYVFFRLAGTRFTDPSQMVNVNAAADLAVAQSLRVRIIGAADSATGSPGNNAALALSRAEHVAMLMKDRGVREDHIEILSEGGTAEYSPVEANRNCRIELFIR
jgi:outer membrane protein OmpA-like peptidoglycan-associated protein